MFDALVSSIHDNPSQALVSAIIVVGGLFVYGFHDTIRFSLRRAWAVSGVCFAESIRRKVLWITPLAMLGVFFVSQLQKPSDEQDAVRQTLKFILFASGMVVTLAILILTCTNLPKDIETRVIFTVVTKPTTRLEIIVGKIIGFAKVSAAILLLMGAFAFIYLHSQAWLLERSLRSRLAAGAVDPLSRPTYEYWASQGLLSARTFQPPQELEIYAQMPSYDSSMRWFMGGDSGGILVPFYVDPSELAGVGPDGMEVGRGMKVRMLIGYRSAEFGEEPPPTMGLNVGVFVPGREPAPASANPTTRRSPPEAATVSVEFDDPDLNTLIHASTINRGQPIYLTDPTGQTPVELDIPPDLCLNLLQSPVFYVQILGLAPKVEYSVDIRHDPNPLNNPVCLLLPGAAPLGPVIDDTGHFAAPSFRGFGALYGQQLLGGPMNRAPIALYAFRNAKPRDPSAMVGFELRVGIERTGEGGEESDESSFAVTIIDHDTHQITAGPIDVHPENNRTCYFSVPGSAVKSGNFDLYIRNLTRGQFASLRETQSLAVVISEESFDLNLLKSLWILWMLSILVVTIAMFCSTFLSWPIAVVLTLLLLLGHWGVIELGDALAPGIGNRVATDIFGSATGQASRAKVVSSTVEAMSKLLTQVGALLPDIGQFSAIDDIERGATIPLSNLTAPLAVLLLFGLPLTVLSYVILRNKEVAP